MHPSDLDMLMVHYQCYPTMYNVWRIYLHCRVSGEPIPDEIMERIDLFLVKVACKEVDKCEEGFKERRPAKDARAYFNHYLVDEMERVMKGPPRKNVDGAAMKIEDELRSSPRLPTLTWETIRREYFAQKKKIK